MLRLALLMLLALSVSGCATLTGETVHTEEVVYESQGQKLNGYLAYDPRIKEPRPGVLVVHEWWGHNDYARKRAEMLAEMGYVAFAVDMYGDGKTADHPSDAGKFAGQIAQNIAVGEARMSAALEVLKRQPQVDPERVAAIGYCFGGGMVLHAARIGMDLDGVVSFHGSLKPIKPAAQGAVKADVLVLNGAADPMVKPEDVTAFEQEMTAAGADFRVVNYPGVKHSFTNPAADAFAARFNLPLAYDAEADQDSWQQMSDFFKKIFKE